MPIVEATLVKRYVDQVHEPCGMPLMEMNDDVPLGKIYRVDLDSRSVVTFSNLEHGVKWACECVKDVDAVKRGELGWLPTQMLMRNGMAL